MLVRWQLSYFFVITFFSQTQLSHNFIYAIIVELIVLNKSLGIKYKMYVAAKNFTTRA